MPRLISNGYQSITRVRACVTRVVTFRFRLKLHISQTSDGHLHNFDAEPYQSIERKTDIIFIAVYEAASIHTILSLLLSFLLYFFLSFLFRPLSTRSL
jgi:hypothetical protein